MPRQIIPIHTGMMSAIDEVGLNQHAAKLHDCYVDVVGEQIVVNRRPGLKLFCDLGTDAAVDGLFWWEQLGQAVAVSNGASYRITDTSGSVASILGSFFTAGNRVTFADYGTRFFTADGGNINTINSDPTYGIIEMADVDAPTTVTHVATLDQYLLANETDTKKCWRSKVGQPLVWEGNYFSKEAQNDYIQAIAVENLELYLVGSKSLEVWYDDGVTPFSRLPQGYIQSGTVAPYSFTYCGSPINTFVWLDQWRTVVQLAGRQTQPLPIGMNRYIQNNYTSITDAAGIFCYTNGHPFYILNFPTESETLVHDFVNGEWGVWSYWNSVASEHQMWRGNCGCLAPAWGKYLVGDRANGKIYELDSGTYQDDSGELRSLIRTGHLDRGDHGVWKRCNRVDFRCKKTAPGGGTTITLVVKYRDNGETTWSNEKTITLSAQSGETDYIASIRPVGRYKTRQWEIYCSDNAPVALCPPIEDFDFLA